jgi:hypothetical protein
MDMVDRFLAQVSTLKELWPSLVVLWAVSAIAIWRLTDWHYAGAIRDLEHRIKLKDDTIAYMERNPQEPSVPTTSSVIADSPMTRIANVEALPEDPRTVTVPPEDRVFIKNKNVTDLMKMLDGNTMMKEDVLARPFIGKWIEITLPVKNVVQREDETLVMFTRPDAFASQIWLHFPGDRERLEILDVGDTLTAVGRITELSSVVMRLYGCEMVKAA